MKELISIAGEFHWWMLLRLEVAVLLGSFIGYDRERTGKPAGLRTHAMVALGATLFTVVSIYGFGANTDSSRVAAMIVSGIGFLGAGAILHERGGVQGLTTAASLWVTAAIGTNSIQGTTDSEHAFTVFLNLLGDINREQGAREIGQALVQTVGQLERWTAETQSTASSYYNFAVTDGYTVAAIRYVSNPNVEPASLYYAAGKRYQCADGVGRFVECEANEKSVVIASERLSETTDHWTRVAPNHLLTVTQNLEIKVELIDIERHGSTLSISSTFVGGENKHFSKGLRG